ncbi:hypothetical protein CF15_01725 [Pyrodictium occultum]|uniref:HTH cro/C1-type domain-containing protein n=1 Tax=Pyrodictium occultum TaxID=2309 RepID=A0A0V8RUG1_PYROC|nr:phosphoribosyltransferase family protein [Pyrodictium occultum]KSW11578.1 hypothetical protein CF15_01725 [Pyrodictium occultum]
MPGKRGGRLERAQLSTVVAAALRLAKRRYSYRELSKATGVPAPLLSRYVTGRSLPGPEKAGAILEGLWRLADPRRALAERMAETGGVLDTSIVLTDPLYLLLATLYYTRRLQGRGVTRILVPEASGIPLATSLSLALETPFTVARRRRPGLEGYDCSPGEPSFCIPRGTLGRSDRVLVVDDIVETGRTLRALRLLVERARARLEAVAAVAVVGEEWRETSGVEEVEALIHLTKPGMSRRMPGL